MVMVMPTKVNTHSTLECPNVDRFNTNENANPRPQIDLGELNQVMKEVLVNAGGRTLS